MIDNKYPLSELTARIIGCALEVQYMDRWGCYNGEVGKRPTFDLASIPVPALIDGKAKRDLTLV